MKRALAALAAGLSAVGVSQAAVVTVDVAADTFVREGRPLETNGAATELRTERAPGASTFRATLLRFDLASLADPNVLDATFNITQTRGGAQQVELFAVADGFDGWDEATLDYTQTIAALNTGLGLTSLGTIDLPAGNAGGRLSLTGQPLVDALNAASTDRLVTFVLLSTQPDNSTSARFASRENATFQGATLDLDVIPLPPAAALFPLGAVLLARGRRQPA